MTIQRDVFLRIVFDAWRLKGPWALPSGTADLLNWIGYALDVRDECRWQIGGALVAMFEGLAGLARDGPQ